MSVAPIRARERSSLHRLATCILLTSRKLDILGNSPGQATGLVKLPRTPYCVHYESASICTVP